MLNFRQTPYQYSLFFRLSTFLLAVHVAGTAEAQALRQRTGAAPGIPSARIAPVANFGAQGRNTNMGVLITSVIPGSAAQIAGLEVRDVVVTVDGFQVGAVKGQIYDLESEVVARWRLDPVVTLLVMDWRTNTLANLRIDSRSGSNLRPPITAPGFGEDDQIRRWFEKYLDREPTQTEMISWQESLRRGTLQIGEIEAHILASREFYDRYGRNNDLSYINALFSKTLGRGPNLAELGRWVAEVQRYPGARVNFVKSFLASTQGASLPGQPTSVVAAISTELQNYQSRMSRFATWGYYGEQSALVYNSRESVGQFEQYALLGGGALTEQQRLARQVVSNSDRLLTLAGLVLEQAKRANIRVTEARDFVQVARKLREEALGLARSVGA